MTIRALLAGLLLVGGGICQDRVASPAGKQFAHYTSCSVQNPCTPEVVITDQSGAEVRRFAIQTGDGPCASLLDVQWAGENTITAECHGNPSLSFYYEVDATTGKVLHEYLGYGFVRSPDLAKVAHVGWIIHFAPPWVKSEYLQVGNTILYPLPPGTKPVEQKALEMAPEVVTRSGLVYAGVHSFVGRFVWSPDSRRVGFVDCLVDYRLRDDSPAAFDEGGKPENERCFVVAVGPDGAFARTPIPVSSTSMPSQPIGLKWADAGLLIATPAGRKIELRVQ